MSFELTAEEKTSILQQRLKSFYAEKFQHELNKNTAAAVNNEEAVKASEDAINTLDIAIATHVETLNALSGE